MVGSPVVDAFDDNDFLLSVLLAENITAALEAVTRTEALRERERELSERNDRLAEFTGLVSHDLRNPLSVAEGRLELAKEDCQSDHLSNIERSLDHMDSLIEELLSLSQAGKRLGPVDHVALAEIAREAW